MAFSYSGNILGLAKVGQVFVISGTTFPAADRYIYRFILTLVEMFKRFKYRFCSKKFGDLAEKRQSGWRQCATALGRLLSRANHRSEFDGQKQMGIGGARGESGREDAAYAAESWYVAIQSISIF